MTGYLCFSADVGFVIPNRFVVGYALDYNEYFRDLNVSLFMSIFCCFTLWHFRNKMNRFFDFETLQKRFKGYSCCFLDMVS